jgi:hypothetical protein
LVDAMLSAQQHQADGQVARDQQVEQRRGQRQHEQRDHHDQQAGKQKIVVSPGIAEQVAQAAPVLLKRSRGARHACLPCGYLGVV